MSRILRYEVPVDDQPHTFTLSGNPVHVAARRADVVEFWVEAETGAPVSERTFQVVGTGHPYPAGWVHRGGIVVAPGHLVWHLMEQP